MHRRGLELTIVCLLFVGWRLLVHLVEAPRLHGHDELFAGAVAEEVIAGRGLPLLERAHAPWCGGSILVAQAAALLFRLTGSNILALRAMSVWFAAVTCLLWVAVTFRIAGARAAYILVALFILMPLEPAKLTVMAWGNHAESTMPTAVVLWAIVRLYHRDGGLRGEPGLRTDGGASGDVWVALLGGAAGSFSAWFSYAAMVPLLGFAFVVGLLGHQAVTRRRGAGWVAGLLLGGLPVLLLQWQRGGGGPRALATHFLEDVELLPIKGAVLLLDKLRVFLSPHLGLAAPIESTYWLATMIAAGWVLFRCRRLRLGQVPAEALLGVASALIALVWSASSFPIAPESAGIYAYRYLAPLTPFLLGSLALGLARLPRRVSIFVTVALVAPNVVYIVRSLPGADPRALRLLGSSYMAYGGHLIDRNGGRWVRALAEAERIPDGPARRAAIRAIVPYGAIVSWPESGQARAPWIEAQLAHPRIPVRYRGELCSRLALLFDQIRQERVAPADGRDLLRILERYPAGEVAPLAQAVIASLGRDPRILATDLCDLVAALPAGLAAAGGRGLGVVAVRRQELAGASITCAASVDLASAFAQGVGYEWAMVQLRSGVASRPPSVAVRRPDFETGVGEALLSYDVEDPIRRQMAARRLGLTSQ